MGRNGGGSTDVSSRVDADASSLAVKKAKEQRQLQQQQQQQQHQEEEEEEEKQGLPLPKLLPAVNDTTSVTEVNAKEGRVAAVEAEAQVPSETTAAQREGGVASESKARVAAQEELVCPSHWSPRQVLLGFVATQDMLTYLLASLLHAACAAVRPAARPPPSLKALDGRAVEGLTRQELAWWLTTKMRAGLSLFFMYNLHYPLIFTLLVPFALPRCYANLLWCCYAVVYGWMLTWDGKPRTSRKWASEWVQAV